MAASGGKQTCPLHTTVCFERYRQAIESSELHMELLSASSQNRVTVLINHSWFRLTYKRLQCIDDACSTVRGLRDPSTMQKDLICFYVRICSHVGSTKQRAAEEIASTSFKQHPQRVHCGQSCSLRLWSSQRHNSPDSRYMTNGRGRPHAELPVFSCLPGISLGIP